MLIIYVTNYEYYTQLIPVSIVPKSGSEAIAMTTFEHSASGQITANAWAYQTTCQLYFLSNTTFKTIQTYNNANIKLKVWWIYGIGAA